MTSDEMQTALDWAEAYLATTPDPFYWEMCALPVAEQIHYPYRKYARLAARWPARLIERLRRAVGRLQ